MASSVGDGVRGLVANCGLGRLRPNIVVTGWPAAWYLRPNVANELADLNLDAETKGKALLIVHSGALSPHDGATSGGFSCHLCCTGDCGHKALASTVDVYWGYLDGCFLLLLADMLTCAAGRFHGSTIRVFVLVADGLSLSAVRDDVSKLVYDLRMSAHVACIQVTGNAYGTPHGTACVNMSKAEADYLEVKLHLFRVPPFWLVPLGTGLELCKLLYNLQLRSLKWPLPSLPHVMGTASRRLDPAAGRQRARRPSGGP